MQAGSRLIRNAAERSGGPGGVIFKFSSQPGSGQEAMCSPPFSDNLPAISSRARGIAIVRIAGDLAEDSGRG